MNRCLEHMRTDSSEHWALYWFKQWQEAHSEVAKAHLCAYLQQACYWAARRFRSHYAETGRYSLADYFQIALTQVNRVLERFEPSRGFSLERYARPVFSSAIRQSLRQAHEADVCTDWALLRKVNQKSLTDALLHYGLVREKLACHLDTWQCFRQVYIPIQGRSRQLERPDTATWQAMAALFDERYVHKLSPGESGATQLENWLMTCARAVRRYYNPVQTSLNAPASSGVETDELLYSLSDPDALSPIEQLCAQEEALLLHQQCSTMQSVLMHALDNLKPQARQILALYYSAGETQQQIASRLGVGQHTISRELQRTRTTLLLALGRWSEASLNRTLEPERLVGLDICIKDWLVSLYAPAAVAQPPASDPGAADDSDDC